MADYTDLRLYETEVLFLKTEPFSGALSTSRRLISGARLVLTLDVVSIDVGAVATLSVKNRFSIDVPPREVLTLSRTTAGPATKVLTDFHSLLDFELTVSGGSAVVGVGVSVYDNALKTDVRIENAEIDVDLDHAADAQGEYDSVRVGDGVHELAINPDGSIPVAFSLGGDTRTLYARRDSVAMDQDVVVVSYTVPAGKRAVLQQIDFSGDNTAYYWVTRNSDEFERKRTWYSGGLDGSFEYAFGSREGLPLVAGDEIKLLVRHQSEYLGDFNGTIKVIEYTL